MNTAAAQLLKIQTHDGFIAALDQSGGSTPKALGLYGISAAEFTNDTNKMFDLVHAMRTRIITNAAFSGERILGAILFENTIERQIETMDTAHYLWQQKNVVPFLKVDKGLEPEADGVQRMKPIPELNALLARGKDKGIFGTKMRSVIKQADAKGIKTIVTQQFQFGQNILKSNLIPVIEPEVDIHCPHKSAAETLLKAQLLAHLDKLEGDQQVIFKLTLPEQDGFYSDFVTHPRVLKVVALSGGYSRKEANTRLSRNSGVVASFSRALTEGLMSTQSEAAFSQLLERSIQSIFEASII